VARRFDVRVAILFHRSPNHAAGFHMAMDSNDAIASRPRLSAGTSWAIHNEAGLNFSPTRRTTLAGPSPRSDLGSSAVLHRGSPVRLALRVA